MRAVLLTDLLSQELTKGKGKDGGESLQRQIYNVIRRAVLEHVLAAGQKLPSSRALALELGVSRITVSLAYERLIAENYLVASSGSGTFVAPTSAAPLGAAPASSHAAHSMALSSRGKMLDFLPGGLSQYAGAFVPGIADASLFPFHIWRRLVARHISKGELSLAGYAQSGAGYRPLQEAVAGYLRISRSVACEPEQVIITSGTHQSVDLCARLLADPGDMALVENPCHWAFPTVLSASGMKIGAGFVDALGLSVEDSHVPVNTKIVVTSPSHHYPTGVVMPLSRRLELLQSARLRNLWVLEDDYDSEFRYDGAPLPSLQGLDTDHRVIYVGTFSKAMFAGVRMGYIVVPPHLVDPFSNACAKLYRPGSLHLQAALADFIHQGHFSQHIKRMRDEYGERQDMLREALTARLDKCVELSSARAGLHLFTRLAEGINYERVIHEAKKDGLVLGLPYFVGNRPDLQSKSVILGYGGVPGAEIGAGVARLEKAIARSRKA